MSAAPMPQPAISRPPLPPWPPLGTTFDSGPGDRDPMDKVLSDNVSRLLRYLANVESSELPLMLQLLEQRKRWVEEEITMERMFNPIPVAPFTDLITEEDLLQPESEVIHKYQLLVSLLDDAICEVRAKMRELNLESKPSDL